MITPGLMCIPKQSLPSSLCTMQTSTSFALSLSCWRPRPQVGYVVQVQALCESCTIYQTMLSFLMFFLQELSNSEVSSKVSVFTSRPVAFTSLSWPQRPSTFSLLSIICLFRYTAIKTLVNNIVNRLKTPQRHLLCFDRES